MAIPKKGTRTINVDGKAYQWFAQVDADYFHKRFIIESIDDNRYQIIGSFVYKHDLVISPSLIKQAIQQAKDQGWKPGISDEQKITVHLSNPELGQTP